MNKVYYKGWISKFINTIDFGLIHSGLDFHKYNFNKNEVDIIDDYVTNYYFKHHVRKNEPIKDEEKIKNNTFEIYKEIYNKSKKEANEESKKYMPIIYKIVIDDLGYLYAKEIISGYLFPIINDNNINVNYHDNIDITDKNPKNFVVDYSLKLIFEITYKNTKVANLNTVIYEKECEIATPNEVEEYLNRFNKGLFKDKKKNIFINNIKRLYNQNTYNDEIIIQEPKKKIERVKQDPITLAMERIEALLYQIGKIDMNLKNEKEKVYQNILNEEDNNLSLNPLSLVNLNTLIADLEFIIQFGNKKKDDDIINYLQNLLNEYVDGIETERTIKDIDNLNELFLKMKNNYSIISQRKVIVNLSYLYIYEIYENKDTILLEELQDSYFNDNLNTILICIAEMIDNEVIENNILINFDNVTPEYVLNIIKNIKFIPKEKNKQKELK